MAIYGQSWRGGGNMSFRNPMSKAAMNNNPTGNQQTLKPSELTVPPQPLGMANLPRPTQSAGGMALKGVVAGIQANPATQPSFGTGRSPYSSDLIAPTGIALGMNRAESARQGAMLSTPQYRSPVAPTGLNGMNQPAQPFSQNGIRVDRPRQPLVGQEVASALTEQPQQGGAYRARGITPGALRQDPIMAFEKFNNPDDFRVATGGVPMIPFGSKGGQVSGGNPMSQAGINSVANARIARAARLNGVTSSGIDQWRKTSPIAQTIRGNADARIANLPQNAAPQVQPILTQQQNPAIAPTPQVQPSQVTGMGDWDSVVNPPAISAPETPVAPPPTASPNAAPNQLIERALAAQSRSMANSIAPESSVPEGISKLPEQALQALRRNLGLSPQAIGINAYRGARNMLGVR